MTPSISTSALFFSDTATTEIYTLSLHDALPISVPHASTPPHFMVSCICSSSVSGSPRSEEHTSELQSRENLVCRLPLEKHKKTMVTMISESKKKNMAQALSGM